MFVNRIRIRVEFGDCDPANIVYFARYFHWFDQCTSALFRAARLPLDELFREQAIRIPVVDARARYLKPSSYGDELLAETQLTAWKKSSFTISHRILRNGDLAVEGWMVHVWATAHAAESQRFQSVPLPAEAIQKLTANWRPGLD